MKWNIGSRYEEIKGDSCNTPPKTFMCLTFFLCIQDLRVIQVVANLVSKAYLEILIPPLKHSRRISIWAHICKFIPHFILS